MATAFAQIQELQRDKAKIIKENISLRHMIDELLGIIREEVASTNLYVSCTSKDTVDKAYKMIKKKLIY